MVMIVPSHLPNRGTALAEEPFFVVGNQDDLVRRLVADVVANAVSRLCTGATHSRVFSYKMCSHTQPRFSVWLVVRVPRLIISRSASIVLIHVAIQRSSTVFSILVPVPVSKKLATTVMIRLQQRCSYSTSRTGSYNRRTAKS